MSENKKVISIKNLPTKSPIVFSITMYLLSDNLNVSQVTWGIVGTLTVLLWINYFYYLLNEESMDIFKEDATFEKKSLFFDKEKKAMNK